MKVGFVPFGPIRGALGFALVSTLVFSTVAFAERWMYQNLTIAGAYGVWTVLFLVASPLAFLPLVRMSPNRRMFPVWFNIAFLAYCALWCAGWFLSPNTLGELVGCTAGSIALAVKGMEAGVHLLRVHDVAETVQARNVWRGLRDAALTDFSQLV